MLLFLRNQNVVLIFFWGRGRHKEAPELALTAISDPVGAGAAMAVAAETVLSVIRFVQRKPHELPKIRARIRAASEFQEQTT